MQNTAARLSLVEARNQVAASDAYDPHADQGSTRSVRAAPIACSSATEAKLLAVLEQPVRPGEPSVEAFRRKEHELGTLFTTLSAIELLALERRFTNPKPGDVLAAKFNGLVPERRARLLAFLARVRWSRQCAR